MTTISTSDAAQKIGINSRQFLRLAKKRGLAPASTYPNPHYRSGAECPLWSARDVSNLMRTNDCKAILARAKPNPARAKADRIKKLNRQYPTVEAKILGACSAMFNLNRHAKWSSCAKDHRAEIYILKTDLIAALYARGLADRVYLHTQHLPAKKCFRCEGTGCDDTGWDFDTTYGTGYDDDDECPKCGGSGIYLEALELVFVVFSFLIDGGTRFTWHQPRSLVGWDYTETAEPDTWKAASPKPIEMRKAQFADAKELVRTTIAQLGT